MKLADTTLLALTSLALAACNDPADPVAPIPVPSSVEVLSGEGQRALSGLSLLEPIVVRVLDAAGRPFPGATVTFAPAASQGEADPASATTDQNGEAATVWTLGPDPGLHTLAVSADAAATTVSAEALDLDAHLDALFVPATDAEVEAVRADWASRDVSAADATVEFSEEISLAGSAANLRVVSHMVAGARHYGAIIVPGEAAAESLPVLVYLHGGDGGVSVDDIHIATFAFGELRDSFVYVIPSFRSEPLEHGDLRWVSEGPSSHWDYDVDDAIALVNVAFESTPEAKPGAYSILGGSRGAGVALLAGIRDERIDRIVAFFGPTDFFDEWVRNLVREAAMGMPRDLPGVAHLDSTVIAPYVAGDLTPAEARLELVRRSSVLFAADLPAVQLHHGTLDMTVSVSQAESLLRAMEALGREPPEFEAFIYGGGGHSFLSLSDAIPRAVAFLARALGAPVSAQQPFEPNPLIGAVVAVLDDHRRLQRQLPLPPYP